MKLSTLMAERGTPDPDYEGEVTNDDNVLAINTSGNPDEPVDNYVVVQGHITGVDAQLNATTQEKQYIREGQSSAKTGTQRTFKVTGDRYKGNEFQDHVFKLGVIYGVGQAVVTDYVWFCLLDGNGEKGKVSIIDNSDGNGNAVETAAIDIDLKKTGAMPTEFVYLPAGTLGALNVNSIAGTLTGDTKVTVSPALPVGMSAKYKTAATVALPVYDDVITTGWTAFVSGTDYTATSGNDIAVVYLDSNNKCKYAGKTAAVIK